MKTAWPADGIATRMTAARLITSVDDLWYPSTTRNGRRSYGCTGTDMTERDADRDRRVLDRLEALGRQGVVEAAGGVPETAPDPKSAFYAMVGYEVKPTRTVPRKAPDVRDRVDLVWHEEADRTGLFDEDGEFLLFFWIPGDPTGGWLRVRDPIGTRLPSRIAAATGNREFIAASLDGRHMCAVSVEEYDDWIITHSFETAR